MASKLDILIDSDDTYHGSTLPSTSRRFLATHTLAVGPNKGLNFTHLRTLYLDYILLQVLESWDLYPLDRGDWEGADC